MSINAAVVGYGYSGRGFHSYLIGLAPGIDLYAISTRNPERQAQAREQHPEAVIYGSMDEMLRDDRVELVVIATPHDTHHDLAIQAMDAGKHVVTDKVMCMNADEAVDMIEASYRNGVMLSVFQNRRWDGDYLTVRKAIADGLLGTPYLFQASIMRYHAPGRWRANRAQSGGILYDWPAHFIDQALQLVEAPVTNVFCRTVETAHWAIDIENYAKLVMSYADDTIYEVEIGNLAAIDKPRWYVVGDLGGLVKTGLDPQEAAMNRGEIEKAIEDPAHRARVVTWRDGEERELVLESVRGSWTSYYRNISEVLNAGAELAVKPEEGLRVMQVYDAAMESARTGRAINL
jgi:scyllo-inositol 2-dehydrogenase (NADP+)